LPRYHIRVQSNFALYPVLDYFERAVLADRVRPAEAT
jgi:hypothetical protein